MKRKELPSVEEIRKNFIYNKKDGSFVRRSTGKEQTYRQKNGYIVLPLKNHRYFASRIAWKLYHGEDPQGDIDHIDGNRTNNRIENLRVVSRAENMRNAKLSEANTPRS